MPGFSSRIEAFSSAPAGPLKTRAKHPAEGCADGGRDDVALLRVPALGLDQVCECALVRVDYLGGGLLRQRGQRRFNRWCICA